MKKTKLLKVLGRQDFVIKEYVIHKKDKTEVLTYLDFTTPRKPKQI